MQNSVVRCKIFYNIPLLTITRYKNNSKYLQKLQNLIIISKRNLDCIIL